MAFTYRIKELRLTQGLSQVKLAKKAAIPRPTLVRYENGTRRPTEENLGKIANAFGVTMDELVYHHNKGSRTKKEPLQMQLPVPIDDTRIEEAREPYIERLFGCLDLLREEIDARSKLSAAYEQYQRSHRTSRDGFALSIAVMEYLESPS